MAGTRGRAGPCALAWRHVTLANAASVFVERPVAHVVHAILDRPVPAIEREDSRRRRVRRLEARDAEHDFNSRALSVEGATVKLRHNALDAEHLLCVGEVDVPLQRDAHPDAAHLEPAVPLVRRLMGGGALSFNTSASMSPRSVGWLSFTVRT